MDEIQKAFEDFIKIKGYKFFDFAKDIDKDIYIDEITRTAFSFFAAGIQAVACCGCCTEFDGVRCDNADFAMRGVNDKKYFNDFCDFDHFIPRLKE